jgi:hypothetical protein
MDDHTIEVVKFYVREEVYRNYTLLFSQLFAAIGEQLNVLDILQGRESNPAWDEEPLIRRVIAGDAAPEFSLPKAP